ncbi:MAG: potassium channel family protein [Thermoleophilia bacterium]
MRPLTPSVNIESRDVMRRLVLVLVAYIAFLIVLILLFARLFQYFMLNYEGEEHSFIDGIYWTITTVSTLGYGDVTFESHAGRLYSGFVTLLGLINFNIMLPFGIMAVLFGPWLERRLRYRPRTQVARGTAGHVIICGWDSVTEALTKRLTTTGIPYVTLVPDVDETRRLEGENAGAIYGRPSDAEALRRVHVEAATLVIANMSDADNTNIALTVASICTTPVVAVVTDMERAALMTLAGAAHTVAIRQVLGKYLAVRATTRGARGYVVDSLGDLLFAEIASHGTPFVGRRLKETGIRQKTGVSVIGIWGRGCFTQPEADTVIVDSTVMLLVGTKAGLEAIEELISTDETDGLVIIVGHGTVGSSAAAVLKQEGVPHVIIDREQTVPAGEPGFILGDATEQSVLEEAGITRAGALMVTTSDDGVNVFLTLAGRHRNPHIRIVARANRDENVAELYAAGADFVVSNSSVGANILANLIEGRQTVFLTEGVHIFWRSVPTPLYGRTLADSQVRSLTGATVVAIQDGPTDVTLDLHPDTVLREGSTLILVGTPESEELFEERFAEGRKVY